MYDWLAEGGFAAVTSKHLAVIRSLILFCNSLLLLTKGSQVKKAETTKNYKTWKIKRKHERHLKY